MWRHRLSEKVYISTTSLINFTYNVAQFCVGCSTAALEIGNRCCQLYSLGSRYYVITVTTKLHYCAQKGKDDKYKYDKSKYKVLKGIDRSVHGNLAQGNLDAITGDQSRLKATLYYIFPFLCIDYNSLLLYPSSLLYSGPLSYFSLP
jgi:hypothetical protein